MSSRMSVWMKQHPLATYFILANGISWIIWSPLVLSSLGIRNVPVLPYHHFFGAFGPILAAIIVTGISSGKRGLRELLGRIVRWRVGIKWHLIALFGPVALFAIAALAVRIRGDAWADFSQYGLAEEFPQFGLIAIWIFHTLTFGLGEEAGWRGYALPKLQKSRSALSATIILSVLWAFWHLPTFWYRPGYASMSIGGIIGWFFSLVTGAVILTWLYNSSKGSVLVVILFHGSVNVAFTSRVAQGDIVNIMGMLTMVWATLLVILAGPANLSRSGKHTLQS